MNQKTVLLHIDEQHINTIVSIIKSIPELNYCSVYLYGSRVNGKSVKFSDVDIALDCHDKPVTDTMKSKLAIQFEKSVLPYTVDIIDINSVSHVFKAKIEKDFVKIL